MKESIRSDILQKVVWKPPLYQSEEIDPRATVTTTNYVGMTAEQFKDRFYKDQDPW